MFEPLAVENLGVFSSLTLNLLFDLGLRISLKSGDDRKRVCIKLFQRISVAIKRSNSVL